MGFYRVVLDAKAETTWFLPAPQTFHGEEIDPRVFGECVKWEGAENLQVSSMSGTPARFALGEFDYPVLDTSVANAVEELDPCVQLIPLSISGRRGHVILNVLRSVECVDEDRSEFDRFLTTGSRPDLAGQYKVFYRLCLSSRAIPDGAHIFRLAGYEIALIVSETMRTTLMEVKGDDGIAFVSVA